MTEFLKGLAQVAVLAGVPVILLAYWPPWEFSGWVWLALLVAALVYKKWPPY